MTTIKEICDMFNEGDGFEELKLIPEYELVQETEWEVECKDFQVKQTIVKIGDDYFEITENRSGNHYSGYEPGETSVCEVVPRVISQTIYESKRK
jgi:hypothetical protein